MVLPVLYALFNKSYESKKIRGRIERSKGITTLLLLLSLSTFGQQQALGLEGIVSVALENNAGLNAYKLKTDKSDALIGTAFNFDKTQLYYQFDENNLAFNNEPLRVFGIQQNFRFPTVYFSEKKMHIATFDLVSSTYEIQKKGLKRNVTIAYYGYQIAQKKERLYRKLDSLFINFSKVAARRFELGETNYLEKITAASKQQQIHLKYTEAQQDVKMTYSDLMKLLQTEEDIQIADAVALKVILNSVDIDNSVEMVYYQNNVSLSQATRRLEKQKLLPDVSFDYFQGSNSQLQGNLYGYQFGLKIPILFGGQASKIKAARITEEIAVAESLEYSIQLKAKLEALQVQLTQLQKTVNYYEAEGTDLSNEILKTAHGSFRNGEINFYQYIQSLESAYEIQLDYLDKLKQYNIIVIAINYLTL